MSRPVPSKKPTVTLTVDAATICNLFMASNNNLHVVGEEVADPLCIALNVIEHAAMELYTLHDALIGEAVRAEDMGLHAWRLSEQLTAAADLVRALQATASAAAPKAAE